MSPLFYTVWEMGKIIAAEPKPTETMGRNYAPQQQEKSGGSLNRTPVTVIAITGTVEFQVCFCSAIAASRKRSSSTAMLPLRMVARSRSRLAGNSTGITNKRVVSLA